VKRQLSVQFRRSVAAAEIAAVGVLTPGVQQMLEVAASEVKVGARRMPAASGRGPIRERRRRAPLRQSC